MAGRFVTIRNGWGSAFRLALFLLGLILLDATSPLARAESVAIPFKPASAPAADLLYKGALVDPDQAASLSRQGVDLSTLDPQPSDLWTPSAAPESSATFPADDARLAYASRLPSPKGLNRVRVTAPGFAQSFILTTSLETHGALARAELLRRLGFHLSPMRAYKKLTIQFKSVDEREAFISNIITSSTTAESRWVVSKQDSPTEATIQDVVLESGQVDDANFQWGIVPDYRTNPSSTYPKARAFRALIAAFTLADIPEAPGRLGVTTAQIFGDSLVFTQRSAPNFQDISTIDDVRWIARKMSALTRDDWAAVIRAGKYPDDISALLVEKVIGRRNQLNEALGIPAQPLPFNAEISVGSVVGGKVTQESYPGYALRFTYGDPDSPVRTAEILRYIRIEGVAGALLEAAKKFNELLTIQTASDVAYQHAYDEAVKALRNGGPPSSNTVKAFGGFLGGFNVGVNRNVVTGNYYGDESAAQLVDSLSVQMQVGYFLGIDGIQKAQPGLLGNVVLQRNYIHVRPVKNMSEAIDTDWSRLNQPSYMKDLAQALNGDDPAAAVKAFLDKLNPGEMFVITDTLAAGVVGQVNIPIANLLGLTALNGDPAFGISDSLRASAFSRTTISRTEKGIQVYLQGIPKRDSSGNLQPTRDVHTFSNEIAFDFDWWINVFQASHASKSGTALTRAYIIDHDDGGADRDRRLARSLLPLLEASSAESLEEDFRPYQLDHELKSSESKVDFLAWRWSTIEEAHLLKIDPPASVPGSSTPSFNPSDYERTFYNTRIERTHGVAAADVVSKAVSYLTHGFTLIPQSDSDDPADTILGHSESMETSTEAELTPSRPAASVSTLEHSWRGWTLSRDDLYQIMDGIQSGLAPLGVKYQLFQKADFASMTELQLYEVTASLLIYADGVEKLRKSIVESGSAQRSADFILDLLGPARRDIDEACALMKNMPDAHPQDNLVDYVSKEQGHWTKVECVPLWVWELLDMRTNYPSDRMGQIRWVNWMLDRVQKNVPIASLIGALGSDNVFFQVRVQGFRKNIEETDEKPTFTSQSYGAFKQNASAGPLRDLAASTGISAHEIYSRYLDEGY